MTMAMMALGTSGCAAITGPGMGWHKHAAGGPLRASSTKEYGDEIRTLEQPASSIASSPEDAVVRIVSPDNTCTGTVIAEDLVLTAHHCLVERGPKGEFSKKLLDPTTLHVEIGGEYFAWAEVGVKHIVAPPCGESGGSGDVAVLVLQRKLIGLDTMKPRLDAPPKVQEPTKAVGFGRCALNGDAINRKDRESGAVTSVLAETLTMEAAICPGDSGGPVLSRKTGQVIGVVSLSAMDHDENTRGASVMARIDVYKKVFENAQAIADGMSPQELPPVECKR